MKVTGTEAKKKTSASPERPDTQRRLRDLGLRRTPVRVAVLEILDQAAAPMDASAITAKIREPIDTVTVYRTLNTFIRMKMIHRVPSDNGWRYAIGGADTKPIHQHPHFICDDCGEIECVKESSVPATLLSSLKLEPRYSPSYAEIIVHGSCSTCRRKTRS